MTPAQAKELVKTFFRTQGTMSRAERLSTLAKITNLLDNLPLLDNMPKDKPNDPQTRV
jgi:hypothetical protein